MRNQHTDSDFIVLWDRDDRKFKVWDDLDQCMRGIPDDVQKKAKKIRLNGGSVTAKNMDEADTYICKYMMQRFKDGAE